MKRHPLLIYTAGATGLTANSMRKKHDGNQHFLHLSSEFTTILSAIYFSVGNGLWPCCKIKENVIVADTLNCKCRGVFSVFWIIFKTRVGTILTGCLISEGIFYFYNWGFVPNSVICVL